jgi:T5SS/PEP-CTERM-associated repeat protein
LRGRRATATRKGKVAFAIATIAAIEAMIVTLLICKLNLLLKILSFALSSRDFRVPRPLFDYWHCRLIGGRMKREPHQLSSIGPRRGARSPAQAVCKFVSSRLLVTTALVAASTVSTHAQTRNWTGQSTSNWFLSGNWDSTFPRQTDDGNINTVTPNATVISDPGAQARNLSVGPSGTGMLTIQAGGTLADSFGTVGNLAGGLGTVTVTGAGSNWSNAGGVLVGGLGKGTLTI